MIKWLREHTAWFVFIMVSAALLIGATMFLLITYREYIFTSSTLALLIFVGLALVIAALSIIAWKVVGK